MSETLQRNKYDRRGNLEQGLSAQDKFVECANLRKWKVQPSSSQDDIYKHIDYYINKKDKKLKIEVKSSKKVNRVIDYSLIWIEIRGVNNPGWLFGGHADYIAFEMFDHFMFVDRLKLVDLVNRYVDTSIQVKMQDIKYHEEIKYITGTRRTTAKPDLLTLVDTWRVAQIMSGRWTKSEYINFDCGQEVVLDKLE